MQGNPFLNFHRSAEAAGYPALLIVSAVCLALVVVPIALLALTQATWVLAFALLSLVAAVAILAGEIDAAFSDYGEPAAGPSGVDAGATDALKPITPRPREQCRSRPDEPVRKAA
jgi:hypothetical protein